MKILILKPSSLGDVVHALPVLRLLRRHLPDAQIHWWIASSLAPLLEDDPDLTGIIRFERKRWASPLHWPEVWQSVRWMRGQNFDWVIDLQGLARSGAFAWLANGKCLVGLDEPREGARGLYDYVVTRPTKFTHAVDWYIATLKPLGVPTDTAYTWLPERPAVAASVREKWRTQDSRWVALQPGARWENKRWPAEYYAEVIRQLAAHFSDLRFAILGSSEDQPLADKLASALPERCLNLAGQTSLFELIEWLRISDVTVTNDSGPMHLAAALGKPVVAMFGPTEPRFTGPYGQLENVVRYPLPCSPCESPVCSWSKPMECLTAIPPTVVFQKIVQQLQIPSRPAT